MLKLLSPKFEKLISSLKQLPGVGKKTAQRMAVYLLEKDQASGHSIIRSLSEALASIKYCQGCNVLCENDMCNICNSTRRNKIQLCVVENMSDMIAIESTNIYRGRYFILHGKISPLDGVGPEELNLPMLKRIVKASKVKEVIMALGPSIEGETTVHFISNMLKNFDCKITRIGFGVPFGGEIEYLDQKTLTHALEGRISF